MLPKLLHKQNISSIFVSVADITTTEIKENLYLYTMNTSNNALTEAVYYILLALVEPIHGYGIMQQTATLSNGRVRLSAGTLYGALASLLDKGWIEQLPEEGRKKGYIITAEGRAVLEQELQRLTELVENGRNRLNNI